MAAFSLRLDLAIEVNRHFLENEYGDLSFFLLFWAIRPTAWELFTLWVRNTRKWWRMQVKYTVYDHFHQYGDIPTKRTNQNARIYLKTTSVAMIIHSLTNVEFDLPWFSSVHYRWLSDISVHTERNWQKRHWPPTILPRAVQEIHI